MLHDILHHLEPKQRWGHAKLLAHLAATDGKISRDELAFFEQRLGASLLSPERKEQLRELFSSFPADTPLLDELRLGVDRCRQQTWDESWLKHARAGLLGLGAT